MGATTDTSPEAHKPFEDLSRDDMVKRLRQIAPDKARGKSKARKAELVEIWNSLEDKEPRATVTGRISSNGPRNQQILVGPEEKELVQEKPQKKDLPISLRLRKEEYDRLIANKDKLNRAARRKLNKIRKILMRHGVIGN